MADTVDYRNNPRHDISVKSNVTSTHFCEHSTVSETLQTSCLRGSGSPRLVKADLIPHEQQDEITRDQQTRLWVQSCHGYSHVGDQEQKRRDSISQTLRSAAALAEQLEKFNDIGGQLDSDKGVKNEPSCQSLQFIGRWTDERENRY
ncbi:hypothetical protein FOPE_12575 [Fonsecaea pedrosoi]|nr:hypothetical protein FOPE_12575 [Fonsecaea pedrosoi]